MCPFINNDHIYWRLSKKLNIWYKNLNKAFSTDLKSQLINFSWHISEHVHHFSPSGIHSRTNRSEPFATIFSKVWRFEWSSSSIFFLITCMQLDKIILIMLPYNGRYNDYCAWNCYLNTDTNTSIYEIQVRGRIGKEIA